MTKRKAIATLLLTVVFYFDGARSFAQETVQILPRDSTPGLPENVIVIVEGRDGGVWVRRTGPVEAAMYGRYDFRQGTANYDYDGPPFTGELFAAGEANRWIPISVIDDIDPEPEENFYIDFRDPNGYAISRVEVRILDNEDREMELNVLPSEPICFDAAPDEAAVDMVMTQEGKFLVTMHPAGAEARQILRRFYANGAVDRTFIPFQAPAADMAIAALPLASGAYAVTLRAGDLTTYTLLRLEADGSVDAKFAQSTWRRIHMMDEAPDGRLWLMVSEGLFGVNESGVIEASVIGTAAGRPWSGGFLEVASNDAIYMIRSTADGSPWRFVRINAEGTVDPTFNPGFIPSSIQLAGAVYAVTTNLVSETIAVRLTASGAIDAEFRPLPVRRSPLRPPYNNFPLIDDAGRLYSFDPIARYRGEASYLTRYDASGNADPAFAPGLFDVIPRILGIRDNAIFFFHPTGSCSAPLVTRYNFAPPPQRITIWPEWIGAYLHFRFINSAIIPEDTPMGIVLARTGSNVEPFVARFRARPGTAQEGTDFPAQSGEVRFAAGRTKAIFTPQSIPDSLIEPTETYYLDFLNEQDQPIGTITLGIGNDDRGLAIAAPTILPDGRWRVRFDHDGQPTRPILTSTDLITWRAYPSYGIDGKQYIDVEPSSGSRYFATDPE